MVPKKLLFIVVIMFLPLITHGEEVGDDLKLEDVSEEEE